MRRHRVRAAFGGRILLALLLVCVAGGIAPTRGALAGDPDLAKFLLKGGKDDLGKKLYDQALTKFERSEREDPALLESVYYQALVRERKTDCRGAVQTYRRVSPPSPSSPRDAWTSSRRGRRSDASSTPRSSRS